MFCDALRQFAARRKVDEEKFRKETEANHYPAQVRGCATPTPSGRSVRNGGQGAAGQAAGRMFVRYRGYIAMVMFTFVMITALGVLTPYISNTVFYDDVLTEGGRFYGEIGKMVLLDCRRAHRFAARLAGQRHYFAKVAAELVYDLKKTIFNAISSLFALPFFSNRQTGGLMTQVNNDATTIYWFFCDGFPLLRHQCAAIHRGGGSIMFAHRLAPHALHLHHEKRCSSLPPASSAFAMFDKLHAKVYSRFGARSTPSSPTCSTACAWPVSFARENEGARSGSSAARSRPRRRIPTSACRATSVFRAMTFLMRIGSVVVWGVGGWQVMQATGDELRHADGLHRLRQYDYGPIEFFADAVNWWAECPNALQRLFEIRDAVPEVRGMRASGDA